MSELSFREHLKQPDVIILDGALGTELERRGIPTPAPLWSASALLTHPGVVREIHEEYIRAGAAVITANTFRTNARSVERAGLGGRGRELTHQAVRLARDARDQYATRPVWIAGSISPVEDCFSPHLAPDHRTALREHTLLATWLMEAGVDLILIETMNTIREAVAATQAAIMTGLPVCVSFTCTSDGRILSEESLADAMAALEPIGVDVLLVNCVPTPSVSSALRDLAAHTSLPVGAYGNLGPPVASDVWALQDEITPDRYCDYAREWIALGAKVVGGCCGTTPRYIEVLRDSVRRHL